MMYSDENLVVFFRGYGINYDVFSPEVKSIISSFNDFTLMKDVLNFLIDEKSYEPSNIENCPSILYLNPTAVRDNYDYLMSVGISREKVGKCLHVLSTSTNELKKTYNYVLDNYGDEVFNKNLSILSVNTSRIKELEEHFAGRVSKNTLLSIALTSLRIPEIATILTQCEQEGINVTGSFFQKSIGEIARIVEVFQSYDLPINGSAFRKKSFEVRRIINVCKEKNYEVSGSVFLQNADEVGKIIDLCRDKNINITGSTFRKTAEEIEKIKHVCDKYGIEAVGTVFLRTADEIEEIAKLCEGTSLELKGNLFKRTPKEVKDVLDVCREFNVEPTLTLFQNTSTSLRESLSYITEKYGEGFVTPYTAVINVNHLKKVLPHLEERGTIYGVLTTPAILTLKYDEILEREKFISSIGQEDVVDGRFNSIYGLSRKNYELYKSKVKAASEGKK